jgi:hypothetical protein
MWCIVAPEMQLVIVVLDGECYMLGNAHERHPARDVIENIIMGYNRYSHPTIHLMPHATEWLLDK